MLVPPVIRKVGAEKKGLLLEFSQKKMKPLQVGGAPTQQSRGGQSRDYCWSCSHELSYHLFSQAYLFYSFPSQIFIYIYMCVW
jgi:hypothetical protein